MTRMTSSEAFVETLAAQGVTHVFGIVGSAYMDALDLFPAAGIRFVSVCHEQGAGHMADGFSPLDGMKYHDMLQEMIVDVASGEGIASPRVFRRSLVNWMIDDRRAYPKKTWPKKDAEANRLETLLTNRPELFF